jgi:hypothetical protein
MNLKKLLCKIGVHDWEVYERWFVEDICEWLNKNLDFYFNHFRVYRYNHREYTENRICLRCEKRDDQLDDVLRGLIEAAEKEIEREARLIEITNKEGE